MAYNLLGKNFTPPDIYGKVTGKAKYAEDYRAEGMVFCRLLTSPMPHAKVKNIDSSAAMKLKGVVGILTAADVPAFPPPNDHILTNEPHYVGDPILAVAAESEQIAFGTGVLVDGLDFSDDKMLVGRTFSYSDTQRHRVGPNYLQLPVNQAKAARVATNQRDGSMAYSVDIAEGQNPSVNYEPSILGGLREADRPAHDEVGPEIVGRLTRKRIPRTNDYQQPGERYLLSEQWEKDDLVANLVDALGQCVRPIQERMVWHLLMAEDELGLRVGEGLGIGPDDVRHLPPLATQNLSEAEQERLANLGKNGPRDVGGLVMTHCVPNQHESVAG